MNVGIVGLGLISGSMAGRERGGFTAATDDLYVGASMILTPDERTDMQMLEKLKTRDAQQLRALLKDGREKKALAGGS